MSEAPRFFVGPEDTEINSGNYRHFFHHADEDEEEEDESVSCFFGERRPVQYRLIANQCQGELIVSKL